MGIALDYTPPEEWSDECMLSENYIVAVKSAEEPLSEDQIAHFAGEFAKRMASTHELTSYPSELVAEWIRTGKYVIVENDGKFVGGALLVGIGEVSEEEDPTAYTLVGFCADRVDESEGQLEEILPAFIFRRALEEADGKPVLVEYTNPAVHRLCNQYNNEQIFVKNPPTKEWANSVHGLWIRGGYLDMIRKVANACGLNVHCNVRYLWSLAAGFSKAGNYKAFVINTGRIGGNASRS